MFVVVAALAVAASPEVKRFDVGGHPVVVMLPSASQGPWPVVYLMGGMGELSRREAVSAAAWFDDYAMGDVVAALERGKVTPATLRQLATPRELSAIRRRLREGYRGVVLVGLPAPVDYTDAFERYVLDEVIPWAERTLPIRPGPEYRGIDGVSLGGRHALRLGLRHAREFASVGAVQGAVRGYHELVVGWATQGGAAARRLKLNLATSSGDAYRGAIRTLARDLSGRGFNVRFVQLTGPHDYVFNRGPGAVDLLLFHDAALNARAGPAP